jgi:hypothetical protein
MGQRIRHCVECPKCHTRYLMAFSPYRNGSYLVQTLSGSTDEYTLYCSCSVPTVPSRWKSSETKPCEVSKIAHDRGYGTQEEIHLVHSHPREAFTFDITRYLDLRVAERMAEKARRPR